MRPLLAVLLLLTLTACEEEPGAPRRSPAAALTELVGRIHVSRDGFYGLSLDELKRLGIPAIERAEIRRHGESAPLAVGHDARALVFLATDTAGPHTLNAVFEVHLVPSRAPLQAGPGAGEVPDVATLRATRSLAADRVWGDMASGVPGVYDATVPTWFLATITRGQGITIPLASMGAQPKAPQELTVTLAAPHTGEVVLEAEWNGHALGRRTTRLDPTSGSWPKIVFDVPADAVPEGSADLILRDVGPPVPPAPRNDVTRGRGRVFIDRVELRGVVSSRIVPGSFRKFDADAGHALRIDYPRRTEAAEENTGTFIAASDPTLTIGVRRESQGSHGVRLHIAPVPQSGVTVYASDAFEWTRAEPVEGRPDPLVRVGDAVHVILATPPLIDEAKRLAAHRTSTGTPSAAVPVTWVYERYGGGEMTPNAIRIFIEALEAMGHLRYVLLAGDASLDRTDLLPIVTIPAPMARTMYNGATASDRLYVRPADGPSTGGPAIGRLPFREAGELKAYVDRLIQYETQPPSDASRRMLRFVTSEGRFGVIADQMIENLFKRVVAESVPAEYDVEITNASATSAFLWPPRDLNKKVVAGINDGCLFYTYVGHGFERGFDTLRVGSDRFPILHLDDVPAVETRGTPPAMFVIACTTAIYDLPLRSGVGEQLLFRPKGPIAYWGATRVCHPAANSLVGVELAKRMARGDGRLGDIVRDAWDAALDPASADPVRNAILLGLRIAAGDLDVERLLREGRWMYALLADPALKIAFPAHDITVNASFDAVSREVIVDVTTELPDGTSLTLSLETKRDRRVHRPTPVPDVRDPAAADVIRSNHARMNDWSFAKQVVEVLDGRAQATLPLPEGANPTGRTPLLVKAYAITAADVHQGVGLVR